VRPVDIAHAPKQNLLTVTWEDGVADPYPVPYLRAWCPCAGCQGHSTTVRRGPLAEVEVEGIFEMGAYAIAIRFSDGHDTGIFTWEWLRRIGPHSPPEGYKEGTFSDGKFVP
jgi:DUF971 family protein